MFVLQYKHGTKHYCYDKELKNWKLVDISGRFVSFDTVENYGLTTDDLSNAIVYNSTNNLYGLHECEVVEVNITLKK